MVSTPSLPSAAHEVADSLFLTDEEAERFLEKFPLVHILECVCALPIFQHYSVWLPAQQVTRISVT